MRDARDSCMPPPPPSHRDGPHPHPPLLCRSQPLSIDDTKAVRPELHNFLVKALSLVRQKQKLEATMTNEPPEVLKVFLVVTTGPNAAAYHRSPSLVRDCCGGQWVPIWWGLVISLCSWSPELSQSVI